LLGLDRGNSVQPIMVKACPARQVLSLDGAEVFRLWQAPEQVLPDVHAQVCLEWKGRLGHPTS
jgi:hypothetical protein